MIVDLSKDDVYNITKAKELFFYDFDYFYSESSRILKNQLKKTHLKSIKNIYLSKDINHVASWIISRLINNMRNISTNSKYKDFIALKLIHGDKNIHHYEPDLDNCLMIEKLNDLPIEIIKGGLKKVYEKNQLYQDFDLDDFEELCNRFGLYSVDIIGYEPRERPKMKAELTKSGNSQLILFFDPNS
jgi:hypothetical protein